MSDEYTTAVAFSTLWEAEVAKSKLEAEGISAFLKDGHTVNMNWLFSNALGGVKVQVANEDLIGAREILSDIFNLDTHEEADTGDTAPCPRCGNENTKYQISKRWTFLTWVLCGIPLIWPRKNLSCNRCGYAWKDDH